MRVAICGQGYVGLPLAILAASAGHRVVGYDVDVDRVKRLTAGESYVDDVTSEVLAKALADGSYRASSEAKSIAGFDIAVVTVPTPLREGIPDLTYIESSARTLARYLRPGATVVLESTTYPGTTEDLVGPILEEESGMTAGVDFYLGYSPERIDPGNETWQLENTPKVVSGINNDSLRAVQEFYTTVVQQTVPVSSCRVAELAKLLENTFRHVNIALVNEIAVFAHALQIDVWEAIDAASTKPFGYMRFTPGPGVGGHCLPIDPSYLSWRVERALGQNFRFVELANDINNHMPDYVVQRLVLSLNERSKAMRGSRVLLLGLAYKKNTGDAREAPAARVATLLADLGAEVRGVDPYVIETHVLDRRMISVDLTKDEVIAADAVVLLTDHDVFDLDLVSSNAQLVLDCRRRINGPNIAYL